MSSPQPELLQLPSAAGLVDARFYEAPRARAAALLVGGVGGGFDSPAMNLYETLALDLPAEGISVLRVRYRNPTDLAGSVLDVRTGIAMLHTRGVEELALVGHSFGGAVVVGAALAEPSVTTLVTLATQLYGTEGAASLGRPVLLLHGSEDEILPASCSERLQHLIGPRAELQLYPGSGHGLDRAAKEVSARVRGWLRQHLTLPPR